MIVAAAVFLLNLPFGYWRSRVPTRSRQWFLAIHLPVPFVIALRVLSGLGWQLSSFPILVGAFFLGQYVGGKWAAWAAGSGRKDALRKVHHPVARKPAVERAGAHPEGISGD